MGTLLVMRQFVSQQSILGRELSHRLAYNNWSKFDNLLWH